MRGLFTSKDLNNSYKVCCADRLARSWLRVLFSTLFAWLVVLPAAGDSIRVEGVRVHEAPDHVRVVLDTSDRLRYSIFTLENPHRVVVDLKNAQASASFSTRNLELGSSPISKVRSAQRKNGAYRVVLDVKQKFNPSSFLLNPVEHYGHRLVIDLFSEEKTRSRVEMPQQGLRPLLVAIDAGHGGEDPGAIGVGKIYEKRVVLGIARQLKKLLDEEPGFEAYLVRGGDYYIALEKRPQLARQERADMFVSIHADAFRSSKVRGASVYTLSEKGASSETALWLAERANHSDLIGGVGVVSLHDKDDLLASVLLDISMNANRSASIQTGEAVLKELAAVTRLHKRRVEQAGFVVLKSPDIPSILVETGYISNPTDAQNLSSRAHQKKLAYAIFSGLTDALAVNPPPDTWLASRPSPQTSRYTVSRGDTLSDIAVKHQTSAHRIRRINKLANDNIRVGQIILLPAP